MTIDWGNIAAAAGVGAVSGLNQHRHEAKQKEQQDYERSRLDAQDKRAEALHAQTVKQNDYTLQANAREQAEINRRQALGERIGQYQSFKSNNDLGSALKTYVDFANQDNLANPNFDQNHALSYSLNNDGTANINVVDRNTGKFIRTGRNGVSFDDLIAATHQQINPVGSYEGEQSARAKAMEDRNKNLFELQKIGLKHENDLELENVKNSNSFNLEGLRQEGANYRAGIKGGPANNSSSASTKTSKAVESGVQGAMTFAQQNAPLLQFMANDPNLYNKTVAMMGIESGGRTVSSYDNSSFGVMQLNKTYAKGFAKQFGIDGDSINDVGANIRTGAALINHLDKKYGGDTSLIAAAYNAGEPAIDKAVASWQKSGQKGHWFEHLNLNQSAREQVYGHIVKYNQALGLLDGNAQPTGMTGAQLEQQNQVQTAKAKDNYRKGISKSAATAVNTVSKTMAEELGQGKETASIIGGLSAAQSDVHKFVSGQSYEDRLSAYQNILDRVNSVVAASEAGMMMTPSARKEYVHQKTAELVGAANKTEAGVWIKNGVNGTQPKKQQSASNLSSSEIDDLIGSSSHQSQPKKQTATTPKTQQIANPFYTEGIANALQGNTNKVTIPYRNS